MSPETIAVLEKLGITGAVAAVIVVVSIFMRFLAQERQYSREEREKAQQVAQSERNNFMTILTNHLEHSSQATRDGLQAVADAMKLQTEAMERLREQCKDAQRDRR